MVVLRQARRCYCWCGIFIPEAWCCDENCCAVRNSKSPHRVQCFSTYSSNGAEELDKRFPRR